MAADHPTLAEDIVGFVLSLSLLLACLVLISTFRFMSSYLLQYSRHGTIQGGGDSFRGTTPQDGVLTGIDGAALDSSFPTMIYSHKSSQSLESGDPNQEEEDATSCCSICLCHYKESEEVRKIAGCGHMFHVVCIDQWLGSHPTCPICRNSPQNPNDQIPRLTRQLPEGHS